MIPPPQMLPDNDNHPREGRTKPGEAGKATRASNGGRRLASTPLADRNGSLTNSVRQDRLNTAVIVFPPPPAAVRKKDRFAHTPMVNPIRSPKSNTSPQPLYKLLLSPPRAAAEAAILLLTLSLFRTRRLLASLEILSSEPTPC